MRSQPTADDTPCRYTSVGPTASVCRASVAANTDACPASRRGLLPAVCRPPPPPLPPCLPTGTIACARWCYSSRSASASSTAASESRRRRRTSCMPAATWACCPCRCRCSPASCPPSPCSARPPKCTCTARSTV